MRPSCSARKVPRAADYVAGHGHGLIARFPQQQEDGGEWEGGAGRPELLTLGNTEAAGLGESRDLVNQPEITNRFNIDGVCTRGTS